jgi:hypothetical protein
MLEEYSPHPIGENLLQQLYTCDSSQYGIQHSESLDFPLIAIKGITRGERRRNLHTKNYKAMLERLHSSRLSHHDQAVTL